MQESRNNVVVHFRDSRILKGFTHDFNPIRDNFHLNTSEYDGRTEILEISIPELKAVFFVKSLDGNKDYVEKKRFDEVDPARLRGIKIRVEFEDGEVMRGISLGYNKNKKGFFIIPVDPGSNNERIYVVADATTTVTVGPSAES